MGGGRYVARVRAAAAGVVASAITLFMAAPAGADPLLSPRPVYDWYVGGGVFMNHHTGFVPNTNQQFNVEKYEPGGKVFVGWQFDRDWAAELSVDYFGSTSFFEKGFATMSTERSFAVTGTVLWFTPPVAEWMPFADRIWMPAPVRLFARGGLAYKNIHQEAQDGTFDEGVLSFVVGGGAQFDIDPRWFMRVEYFFVSSALNGPSQPFSALNGLFTANLGGTARVVNVMNTEIAVSGGFRF